jgi:alpha-D-ribose 1-methylphosphonate 5-triphosphate synthase subunit PhnH
MDADVVAARGIDLEHVQPGFAMPGPDTQQVFRLTLEAMAYPGRIVSVVPPRFAPPTGIPAAAAAVLLTLCDPDTPLWCAPGWRTQTGMLDTLRFHTGVPIVTEPAAAAFALADSRDAPMPEAFRLGDDLDPQDGATLLLAVDSLTAGQPLRLSGPGLERPATVHVGGPDPAFWRNRIELEALFPRGLDLLLTTGEHLMALPRTTHLELV